MRKKEYRGFPYNYDLGSVKVAKPIPRTVGRIARKWLDYFALTQVELMLIARKEYDPLSSGSGFILYKGEVMLSPSNLTMIRERDFDFICIIMEDNIEKTLFKRRDEMEKILLRELIHIVYPDTIGKRDRCSAMVEELLAQRK